MDGILRFGWYSQIWMEFWQLDGNLRIRTWTATDGGGVAIPTNPSDLPINKFLNYTVIYNILKTYDDNGELIEEKNAL